FTTPPAPQISSLSLHDALPICVDGDALGGLGGLALRHVGGVALEPRLGLGLRLVDRRGRPLELLAQLLALRLEVAAPGLEVVEALLDRGYRGLARLEQLQHLLLRALEVRGDLRREQVLDAQLGELTEQVLALDVELEELGVRLREVGV